MDLKKVAIGIASAAVTVIVTALGPGIKALLKLRKYKYMGISERKKIRFMDVVDQNRMFSPAKDMCFARVFGGSITTADTVPYQMSLRTHSGKSWRSFCGGSLLTYVYVLTAAHCLYGGEGENFHKLVQNVDDIRIVGGADKTELSKTEFSKIQSRKVRSFWRHPTFRKYVNDVGLLEAKSQFFPSSTVNPIKLKTPDITLYNINCVLSGFGKKSSTVRSKYLRMACVPQVGISICRKPMYLENAESLVCAGTQDKDSCRGDSGGPLACSGYLVGMVSFSSPNPSYPAVFMKLEYYMKPDLILVS